MKITADEKCFLTEAGNVALDKRTFKKMVITASAEEAARWKQVTEEEKTSMEAKRAIFANNEITPEYLGEVELLVQGVKAKVNGTPMAAEEALKHKGLFPVFDEIVGQEVGTGYRFTCGGVMYEAIVPHKVEEENRPSAAMTTELHDNETALYKLVTTDKNN